MNDSDCYQEFKNKKMEILKELTIKDHPNLKRLSKLTGIPVDTLKDDIIKAVLSVDNHLESDYAGVTIGQHHEDGEYQIEQLVIECAAPYTCEKETLIKELQLWGVDDDCEECGSVVEFDHEGEDEDGKYKLLKCTNENCEYERNEDL